MRPISLLTILIILPKIFGKSVNLQGIFTSSPTTAGPGNEGHRPLKVYHTTAPIIVATSENMGAVNFPPPISQKPQSIRRSLAAKFLSAWGVSFVLSLLGNTMKRLVPIALQPIINKDLSGPQAAAYFLWCVFLTYVEGYKAFHLKFAPLVVRRSLTLIDHPSFLNYLLAGPYCMGLFYSTKKRKIISWSVTTGVAALVMLVKKLPYPWRSIIDGGVVCGLSFGALSISIQFIRGIFGYFPDVDPCLPEPEPSDITIDKQKSQ